MSDSKNSHQSTAQNKSKKKGAKFQPLPAIHAAEESLPWHVECNARTGRHAVADNDIPAGTLIYAEHPFTTVPIAKYASAVCHRCMHTLPQTGETLPPVGNPCLPRYCQSCKTEKPSELDAKLTPLRIKLPEIATQHSLDPIMLHLLIMFDLQRSGIDIGVPPTQQHTHPAVHGANKITDVRCTIADFDALTNVWDKKPEGWRKKVGPAVRQLHKELTALAESKALPGYTAPSAIARLQGDAAQLTVHLQTISAPRQTTDASVGLFPGLSVFQHSCVPNAYFLTDGDGLYVRTILDIKKGDAITVAYVNLVEPRNRRRALLEAERHVSCSCARCEEPIEKSIDRLLEGIICPACRSDVILPLPAGPVNDEATEEFKERIRKDLAHEAHVAAKRAAKSKGKQRGGKQQQITEDNKETSEDAAAADATAENSKEASEDSDPTNIPEGVIFWKCCSCNHLEPAHNVKQSGPGDVTAQAYRLVQQGNAWVNTRHPELTAQGEDILEAVAGGMDNRLSPYHTRIMDALAPLINLNIRKGEPLKVLNHAVQLWDVERSVLEQRVTMQQLNCLEAIVDAANNKAKASTSAVMKHQFEKKLKAATGHLKETKKILMGV